MEVSVCYLGTVVSTSELKRSYPTHTHGVVVVGMVTRGLSTILQWKDGCFPNCIITLKPVFFELMN
jgi:hypothetical protein